ncbi:copper transport protein [Herbihabitans rhizosphaerae]|uniref:Copper transport protein n=1 Tax=Herbihabitans rhizosphaerae TaxID=1872711 RepID=A0A4Q7KCM8_9PSEU|nr:CopD family protein [Herbihabitans rhizosphaerae]RZS31258.1 copper transport protein [Herbihabitans rhizosphaerae]
MTTISSARAVYVLARAVDYLGTAVFLGGLVFLALVWPAGAAVRSARRLVVIGWFLGMIGTVTAIGLQGVWATDRPMADVLSADLLGQVLDLRFGQVWFAKALLWVLAGVVLADLLARKENAARSVPWRVGAGAVGLGLLRATGMTGHIAEAGGTWWAQLADLVHQCAISVWIGGLVMLLLGVLPRRQPDELHTVVPRYSRFAMFSVLAIVSTGALLGWQVLGGIDPLTTTDYGRLLLIKVGLLGVVLAAAFASKTWVDRRLDLAVARDGDVRTVRPFVFSVAAETVVVIFVLIAASLLVTASPGR